MASGKKGAKGNKTAHVLNLLTAPGEVASTPAEEEEVEETAPETAPSAASRPLLPPILEVAQANDDHLSQQIQQALEEELIPDPIPEPVPVPEPAPAPAPAPSGGKMNQDEIEKMLASMAASDPEPAPAPAPAPSGGKMNQDEIEKMLASMAPPDPEPTPTPPPAPAPAPKPEKKPEPPQEDIEYINVMQVLVEEKAPRYIKMFGLCTCQHCQADVKALTLSNLVPKYVVLPKIDRIPMLTVYEGRFNSTIFAQLTRACKVVMDHPRHDRQI